MCCLKAHSHGIVREQSRPQMALRVPLFFVLSASLAAYSCCGGNMGIVPADPTAERDGQHL